MANASRMDPALWCYACKRLNHQPRAPGDRSNGCARCGSPASTLEAVVDVMDARAFLDSCHPDARLRRAAADEPLPSVTVRDAGRDCAVCLEELRPGSRALVTPCEHVYHARCIAPWVEAKGTCPICRTHVGAGARDGLVMCSFSGGRRLGLGRRVAGRISSVKVLDADGNLKRPRARPGLQGMLLHARISVGALLRRDHVVEDLDDEFVSIGALLRRDHVVEDLDDEFVF